MKQQNYAHLLAVLLFTVLINTANGQRHAPFGYSLPPNPVDTNSYALVKALIVFAEHTSNYDQQGIVQGYGYTSLPAHASSYCDFTYNPAQAPTGTLTKYFWEASFGKHILVADYLDHMVQVSTGDGYATIFKYIDSLYVQGTLQTRMQGGSALSEFDQWSVVTMLDYEGVEKEKAGNGKVDALIILWKDHVHLPAGSGHAILPKYDTTNFGPFTGCDNAGAFGDSDWRTIQAEYFHPLFGGNNFHTGSGAAAWTFLTSVGSWSITGQSSSSSRVVNGWDRFQLHWYHPDNTLDTIAAMDTGYNYTVSDLSIATNPDSITLLIRDHTLTGDAVRIKLPHLNWQQSGDIKHQYLWLENRQQLSDFDLNSGCNKWMPGLYPYLQAGKDVKRGTKSELFSCVLSGCGEPRNGLGNWLMPLTAEGNFDFRYETDSLRFCNWAECCWGNNITLPINRYHNDTRANPFTGFNSLFNTYDYDTSGILGTSPAGYFVGLSEIINDSLVHNAHLFGSDKTAFRLGGNHKLALYTNPAPLPVYTYKSNNYENSYITTGIPSWENRIIYLNGLSIEILDTLPNATTGGHDIKVKIKWDDYDVLENVRWTGNIVLQNDTLDPYERQSQVVLAAGKKIFLDRGRSPTQHVVHDTLEGKPLFTRPTVFTAREGTLIHLKEGSTFYVRDDSKLVLEDGARILAEDSACIVVEGNGVLELHANNNLTFNGSGATLVIKSGGTVRTANGVDFTFSGSGYVQVYAGGLFDLGQGSKFRLEGSGKTDLVLRLHPGAQVQLNGHDLELRHGKVLHENSSLGVTNAGLYVLNTAIGTLAEGSSTGITGDSLGYAFIGSSDFTDLSTGIRLAHSDTLPTKVSLISGCTFYNVDFVAIELERMHRHMHITSCTLTGKGLISQDFSYTGIRVAESKLTTITGSRIGGYTQGIEASHVDGLYLNTTVVDSNTTGLYVDSSNVFIRRTSYVRHNETGVDMRGSLADSKYLLVVGDLRCGNIMQNTTSDNRGIGIKGTNMQLHIDAARHAMARGDSLLQDVAPNRFDGNNKMFNICYDAWKVDTVYARYNYWGGAGATNIGILDNLPASGTCRSPGAIVLNDDHYLTSEPSPCTTAGDTLKFGPLGEGPIVEATRCTINLWGTNRLLAGAFIKGYQAFLADEWAVAKASLDSVAAEDIVHDTTVADGCRQCVLIARALVKTAATHAAYDSLIPSDVGKRGEDQILATTADPTWRLYPNPAKGTVLLAGPADTEAAIVLTDIHGRTVHRLRYSGHTASIPLTGLGQGIYVVVVRGQLGEVLYRGKLVVE